MTLFFIYIVAVLLYSLFILWLTYGVRKTQQKINVDKDDIKGISVLIPFRNEAHNLPHLLLSLSKIEYPKNKVEFIFINDHSTDCSVELINEFAEKTPYKVNILSLGKEEGKKKALNKGIQFTIHSFIVTTDADCIVSPVWLKKYNLAFANSSFVLAPVVELGSKSLVSKVKEAESVFLAGTLIGSAKNKFPLLASGANLGYKKSLYTELSPYEDNWQIASGDDMFFLDKVVQKKSNFAVLESNESMVFTSAKDRYLELVKQSIRWGSKTKHLKSKRYVPFGVLLVFINLLVLVALLQSACCGSLVAFGFLYTKFLIDYLFYFQICKQSQLKTSFFYFLLLYVLYPIHLLIIFVVSMFVTVHWKQRKLN